MPEFLLEVGGEAMPAGWLSGLTEQLRQRFTEMADRERLVPEQVRAFSTPRRLVLAATIVDRQPAREEQVFGPSLRAARDAAGKWTAAAEGFARKNNVAPEDLGQAPRDPSRPQELNLVFLRKTPGRDAAEILPSVIASVLRSLAFPKRMSWDAWIDDGKGAFPFGRPIRWIVALLDGRVVPFAIHALVGGEKGPVLVQSGTQTVGHRFLPRGDAGRPLGISSFADLKQTLARHFVLVDPADREVRIREGLKSAAAAPGATDHELVTEWRDLVEFPTVLAGRVPDEFQTLPVEVLDTVLVHHQKYIPLRAQGGRGARFAAVINGDGANPGEIVRGMERVVVARLRDAAFFFAEDRKRPLADRVSDLEGVVFHQGLGTYKDKAERMVRLVDAIATLALLGPEEHQAAREAALLAKADLTTLMVREFPELQGIMGGIYLGAEGSQRAEVARAVRWHYHPLSIEEASPPKGSLAGAQAVAFGAVSLADKVDTLAGYFALGLTPKGSSDPFGLRRAALGVIRVLLDFWGPAGKRLNLTDLISVAVEGYSGVLKNPPATVAETLELFFLDRLEYVLVSRGLEQDEVTAAVHTPAVQALSDVHDVLLRVQALHRARSEAREDFEHLAVAFKRAKNILEQHPASAIDPKLFESDAERELHAAVGRLSARDGSYEDRLRALAELRAPVDRFFDDVLVMAEDEKLRANRLGLLHQTVSLFYRIADISKLGGSI